MVFGVRVDACKKEIYIAPNLADSLKGEKLAIKELMVFDGVFLDVAIENGKINYNISNNSITVKA